MYVVSVSQYNVGDILSNQTIYDSPRGCFNSFEPDNKIYEVEILKSHKVRVIKELTWYEVLDAINEGERNTGYFNKGNLNCGNSNWGSNNTGNKNSGYYNCGNINDGVLNTGWGNQGVSNSGNHNKGKHNGGDFNVGNFNNGDINIGNYHNGVFNCGDSNNIYMFNRASHWTYEDWLRSKACRTIKNKLRLNYWVDIQDMSIQERIDNPRYKELGGYLKTLDYKEAWQEMWDLLTDSEKQSIIKLPNFDKDVFFNITGITIL